ncbi:hypothetical protein, partial [Thiolapillus sp.]|uniref:hypothetical protein n=2 Tax=Thiolapillus sp. TaxID=2017437 RepID=UPI003AF6155E
SMARILLGSEALCFTSLQEDGCDKGAGSISIRSLALGEIFLSFQTGLQWCYPGDYFGHGTLNTPLTEHMYLKFVTV